MEKTLMAAAISLLAFPAFAQTTTTTTTNPPPPQAAPPPPPSPSTQVVVNPQASPPPPATPPPDAPPPVIVQDDTGVVARPAGRSAVKIIAVDAIYGGVAGAVIGGGITLIDQGNHWARDLTIGTGVGVLAGAAYGVFESATEPGAPHAVADRDPAASDGLGIAPAQYAARF
jgi:hypothetical protein